jgi:hypothetical protein
LAQVLIYKCVHKKENDFDIRFMRAFKDTEEVGRLRCCNAGSEKLLTLADK